MFRLTTHNTAFNTWRGSPMPPMVDPDALPTPPQDPLAFALAVRAGSGLVDEEPPELDRLLCETMAGDGPRRRGRTNDDL
jgi:hypothetical protein